MPTPTCFRSAISAFALAGVLAGCAGSMSRQGSTHAYKGSKSELGLATRAHAALSAGDFATAIALGERAVEKTPQDALLRGLLGNGYFAAGRFASAEAAYRDSLTLASNQPRLVLKLALVQIAQGKTGEALAFLNAAGGALDAADYGLALALAGRPAEAVQVLDPTARTPGADARVRQNLALAQGLAGDWEAARTIAAQDLSPDQVNARVQQWMALSRPGRASDQVAALVGVTPAPVDPGQPVRLALRDGGTRLAQLSAPTPAPVQPAYVPPAPSYQAPVAEPVVATAPVAEPVVPEYQPPAIAAAFEAPAAVELASAPVAVAAIAEPAPPPPLVAALAPTVKAPKRIKPVKAAMRSGSAAIVVQLGAYSSRGRVEAAWNQFAKRHSALRQYTPTSARFASSAGPVYRLSVKGFASAQEAGVLCSSLRRQGKNCFVRRTAGDSPVQFASR